VGEEEQGKQVVWDSERVAQVIGDGTAIVADGDVTVQQAPLKSMPAVARAAPHYFVGREDELAKLSEALTRAAIDRLGLDRVKKRTGEFR